MIPALLLLLSLTSLGGEQKPKIPKLQIFARIEASRFQALKELLETLRQKAKAQPFSYRLRRVGVPSKGSLPPAQVFDLALGIPRIEVLRKTRYLWKKAPLAEGAVLLGLRTYAPFLGGAKLSRMAWPEFLRRDPKTLLLPDPLVEPTILEALASVGEAFGRDHVPKIVLAGGLVRFLTSSRIQERLQSEGGSFGVMGATPQKGEKLPAGQLLGVVSRSSRHPLLAARVLLLLRDSLGNQPLFGMGLGSRRRTFAPPPEASLLEASSYWEGNQQQDQPESWIDTVLLILFGLAFVLLARTALRR